ncbi:hypothetical protein G6F65_018342 [Rhizopus arrhizus]|nr:hypothetical protein G6F65_018342 [Rhizopus arrhizus]
MTIPSSDGATVPSAPCTRDDADPPWRFFHHALTGLVPSGSGPPIHRLIRHHSTAGVEKRQEDGRIARLAMERAPAAGWIARWGDHQNAEHPAARPLWWPDCPDRIPLERRSHQHGKPQRMWKSCDVRAESLRPEAGHAIHRHPSGNH